MKTWTMVAAALSLLLAVGCKKKDENKPATGTTTGSAPVAPPPEPAPKPVEPPKPAPKTGKDLAQAFLDCGALLSAGKVDDFAKQCVADSFVGHRADDEDVTRDKLLAMFPDMKAAFPDMKIQPQLVLVNGRNILAVNLMTGTNEGPLKSPMGELPATKKKIGVLSYERLAINDDNKATEQWGYFDPGTMLGQLGHLPKGAPPKRPAMEKGMADAPVIVVAADDDKEKANLAAVKKQIEAFGTKKAADVLAIFADDAVEADQAAPADVKGKKNIEKGLQSFWKAFPDGKIDVPNVWAVGDYVVAEGTFTGTNTGPMDMGGKPMPKTGKPVSMHYAEIFKFKDGKATELWRFMNSVAMAKQLGLMPEMKPGDAGKAGDKAGDKGAGKMEPGKAGDKGMAGDKGAGKMAPPPKGAEPAKGAEPPK